MERGLVSVMMPAYNAERYVRGAIESVVAQTYSSWELIVVNDGSTDTTREVVATFKDARIRLIDKVNGGESSARNAALAHSRGEFIAYLDADDEYLPQHLALAVGFLGARADCDAVYFDGFHMDQEGRRLAPLQSRRRGPFEGSLFEEVVLASDVFGPPSCVVLRHEVIAGRGLRYDERIVIGPDWDFFVRCAATATFGYIAEPTCLYRVHQSNITSRVDQTRRNGYLALCRENAIKMDRFRTCSAATRTAVFYDLLVNLLPGQSERRHAVTGWREFGELPTGEQARLLRLTAVDAILRDPAPAHVGEWLDRARRLSPTDRRARVLAALYAVAPALCYAVLRVNALARGRRGQATPFADLRPATATTRPADPTVTT